MEDWIDIIPPANIDDAVKICDSKNNGGAETDFYFDIDTSDSYWKNKIDASNELLSGN